MGLRGLCVVGIVYCLNQDFQDYRIFRIGRVLYTFRTAGVWNVGFRSSTQPTRYQNYGRGDPAPTMMRDLWDYADYVL